MGIQPLGWTLSEKQGSSVCLSPRTCPWGTSWNWWVRERAPAAARGAADRAWLATARNKSVSPNLRFSLDLLEFYSIHRGTCAGPGTPVPRELQYVMEKHRCVECENDTGDVSRVNSTTGQFCR